jgi:YD repeat-containing protein
MDTKTQQYDRTTQDVGNIVHLEHFNCLIDDQRLVTAFHVVGLGGTRDPYIFTGLENIWINFGRTQIHMPSRGPKPKPEVLRGTIGLVVPDLERLRKNLEYAGAELKRVAPEKTTKFSWQDKGNTVEATCPWGNRFRCHAPSPEFGPTELGIAYVDFGVPHGTGSGIARFYEQVMKAPAQAADGRATVKVGRHQRLIFTETSQPLPEYDGHHIQIYIADFSTPYRWLKERDLITMETDEAEWRFQWIVDPRDGKKLFQIEHEVRSLKHRLFGRTLVNRNQTITNVSYVPGYDAFRGTY